MTEARNCDNCGVKLRAEASFCVSCGAQTDMGKQFQTAFDVTLKGLIRTSVISLTLTLVTLATFWSLLNIFVPQTWVWVQAPINIGFLLLNVAFAAKTVVTLKKLLSGWIAWAICFGILLLAMVVRSVELEIFENIFKS